jgi:hypothetical protein
MAGRILNRRELREQAEQAERQKAEGASGAAGQAVGDGPAPKKTGRVRPAAAAKAKKPRAKKAAPRRCARWGVFDAAMKQVAIFDYNQRAAAEEKLAALLGKQKGIYFLQLVKEPMPEAAPTEPLPPES